MLKQVTYNDIARFTWAYWRRRLLLCGSSLALMMTAVGCDMIVPVYVGKTVDVLSKHLASDHGALGEAMRYFTVFVALAIGFSLLRSSAVFIWNIFAVRTMRDIVTEGMRKVQRFSADWHANAFAGATVRKITRGMWSFDAFEDTWFFGLFPAVAMMLGMATMLCIKVPDVGLFTASSIVVYSAFSIWAAIKLLAPRFRNSAAADTKMGATLADIITGVPTVKAFGAEKREDQLFDQVAMTWHRKSILAWNLAQSIDLIRSLMRMFMMAGMFGVTIWMWSQGRASAGDIALVLTSFFIVGGYLRDIGQHISNLQKSASELEDIVHFWMREDDVRDRPGANALAIGKDGKGSGEIEFDRVTFGYGAQNRTIFEDFSIKIRSGEKIALVGPSGSGKSTFAKLLQRMYDIQSGEIRIDGQNIAAVTQESLRHAIALVPQDPILFHRSLSDNIAYGRPGAEQHHIERAASEAFAHDFISGLPAAYDTLVGERGVKLSGGERQRVAIARAILADASILILDEATSSLDSISEHYIQKALESLMQGKTTITIAHRLATIRKADRILVFEHGRIVEDGTHDELMRGEMSHYKKLFDMQALDLVG